MGLISRFFNITTVFLACTLISFNSQAEEAATNVQPSPFHLQGKYVLKYEVLPIGELAVDGAENESEYYINADARLIGVAKLVSDHKSQNQVNGVLADADTHDFAHAKREFRTHYTSSDGWRTITLGYDAKGALIKEEIETTNEMKIRPKVADELKNGVPDTMTMVLDARQTIYRANLKKQTQLSQRFYDGKRLSNVKMQIYGIVNRTWKGVKTPVLKVGLLRVPVAGYTEKELKRDKQSPMSEALIYFSANDDFIPILGELPTAFGTFRAELK